MTTLEKILQEIEETVERYKNNANFGTVDICYGMNIAKKIIKKHLSENDRWIPVEERLPEEHDSMFAKFKGTNMWSKAMFEKISDDVNATVEYEDGTRKTITTHTLDGKWKLPGVIINKKVIAWRPLPEPYRKDERIVNNV